MQKMKAVSGLGEQVGVTTGYSITAAASTTGQAMPGIPYKQSLYHDILVDILQVPRRLEDPVGSYSATREQDTQNLLFQPAPPESPQTRAMNTQGDP